MIEMSDEYKRKH